jgi:signal transduction histidine kinase/CheY-like chemotaxis protein
VVFRYVVGVAAAFFSIVATAPFHSLDEFQPSPVFLLTVVAVAWAAGFGPAVVALAISTVAMNYLFVPPFYDLAPTLRDVVWLLPFVAVGLVAARLTASRRRIEQERTRLIDAEHAARAAAESANRAKDEFLAVLAHELRNPLAAISTAALLLQRIGKRDDAATSAREVILRQAQHLARMVDDLLEVNRVIAGKIVLQRRPTNLADAVRSAVTTVGGGGRLDPYNLTIDTPPIWVEADAVRLEQVIVNLLENAVKYTPPGGSIDVAVKRDGKDAVLSVRDSGIGIPPDLLPRVFDLFVQADAGSARSRGGLGIGLAVVRRLIQLHGGTVRAMSDGPGRGSRFVVRLPEISKPPRAASAGDRRPTTAASHRVLIVEDDPDTREMLRRLLQCLGHEVAEAEDGRRAIEVALRFRPEIVLIDISLPVIDGWEVARRLRNSFLDYQPVLVALTARVRPEDRERSHEAGFDHHLVKPIDSERLAQILT